MNFIKITIICIALALLTACASVPEMQKKLDSSTQSTISISGMEFLNLKVFQEQKVTLGEKSPTYVFENGKNYYSAFRLPDPQSPKYLRFKFYLSSGYVPSATVLIPQIMLLDDKKKTMGILKDYRVENDSDFFLGSFFIANVPLPANVSYVVLYAAKSYPQKLTIDTENGNHDIPIAPAGNITITLGEPLPADYDFSTVLIKDSALVLSGSAANIFYVSKIDDKAVKNSLQNTITGNQGRGMVMDPRLLDREVAANKTYLITIEGATHYGAPIQELFNKTYHVSGQIKFIPEKNKIYVVKGELGESATSVWIEEEDTHKIMDRKIEGH